MIVVKVDIEICPLFVCGFLLFAPQVFTADRQDLLKRWRWVCEPAAIV